jgi:hypothetical protein
MKLKRKCEIAMLIPLDVLEFNIAAMNAVIVVPTLAPMINGAASFKVAIFFATMGTTTDVVMVLDRIAAVVSSPHEKDLSGFVKKKRLNLSGDFAASRSEINLLKMRIEENKRPTAIMASKNGLSIVVNRKSIIGANPDQKCAATFSVGLITGMKNKSVIQTDSDERKP